MNTGCTPTKTLVACAYAAHLARRAGDYAVTINGSIGVDMKAVKARKDAVAGASRRAVERPLKTLEGCTVYEGHARFTAEKSVVVGDIELSADRIFINVGGRASIPPIPGLNEISYFTNSSMMDVDFLPGHLIVLGGSYIGLEFAQIFRRFGSDVSVVELAPRLIAREVEGVSRAVAEFLKRRRRPALRQQGCRGRKRGKPDCRGGQFIRDKVADHRHSLVGGNWPAAKYRRSWPKQGWRRRRSS